MNQRILVIVATYNERDNLEQLVRGIMSSSVNAEILVVDDSSPDGTGELADRLSTECPAVGVLHRRRRNGLGPALLAGFTRGLESGYDLIVNLDGDLSHNPDDIPTIVDAARKADLVIGSRYTNGIRVVNWPPHRLMLSLLAARYVQVVTGMPVKDPTSGFRCFRRETLQEILRVPVISNGYGVHIEMVHKAWRKGLKVIEVPILFTERRHGSTKLNKRIVLEAAWITWRLLFQSRFRRAPADSRTGGLTWREAD